MEKGKLLGQGRTAEIYAWPDQQILKLFRANHPASWAEHEFEMTRYVYEKGYTVPYVSELVEIDGRKGIVFERIDGPTMFNGIKSKPWQLKGFARLLAEVHARMHEVEAEGLPSQRKELETAVQNNETLADSQKEAIREILQQLPDENRLCHGDFHPDNLLLSSRGPIVIDWTAVTQGNPLADAARTSLLMQMDTVPPGMPASARWLFQIVRRRIHAHYIKRYLQIWPATEQQMRDWLLVSAAARLNEEIGSEKHQLLTLIDSLLQKK